MAVAEDQGRGRRPTLPAQSNNLTMPWEIVDTRDPRPALAQDSGRRESSAVAPSQRSADATGVAQRAVVGCDMGDVLTRDTDARSRGQRIVVTHGHAEVTPAEAAALLDVSRPQVRKFMDRIKLGFRMVGAHYRTSMAFLDAFRAWEREQMTTDVEETGLEELSRLQNELGLFEGPLPRAAKALCF